MRERRQRMSKRKIYFIKHKLIGILIIIISVISAKLTVDGTAALFLLPIGIYTMLTQKNIITDTYFFEDNS